MGVLQRNCFRLSLAVLLLCTLAITGMSSDRDLRVLFLVRNTMLLALGTCAVAIPIGTLLAVLLLRTDTPGRGFACSVFATMLFVPVYLQAAGWDAGLGPQGWLSRQAGSFAIPVLQGWTAAIWIHGVAAVPWVMLIVGLGLQLVEPELEEAALLDTSTLGVLVRVTLPSSFPAVVAAALWISVMTANEIAVTDLYQIRTYAEEVYISASLSDLWQEWQGALPSGLACGCGLTGLLVLAALIATAQVALPDRSRASQARQPLQTGSYRWLLLLVLAMAVTLLAGVPLGNLAYKAGAIAEQHGDVWVHSWSWHKLARVVGWVPAHFGEEFVWSLTMAGASACVALALGTCLAWLARRGMLRAVPTLCVTAICMATPGPILGLGLIGLFNRSDSDFMTWCYDRTILTPVLAQTVRALPVTILVIWHALRSLADDELESAMLEGAGPFARFWWIAMPQRAAALLAAWLAAFAVSVGDLAASILVVPPGVTTLPIRVFGLLHSGVDDQAAGICLVMSCGFAALANLAFWLSRRGERCIH